MFRIILTMNFGNDKGKLQTIYCVLSTQYFIHNTLESMKINKFKLFKKKTSKAKNTIIHDVM